MRCYICNSVIDEPQFNQDYGTYDPCTTCLVVVEDTLSGYYDKPSADTEGDDLLIEGIFPTVYDPFGDDG